jgi:hypothetical protein
MVKSAPDASVGTDETLGKECPDRANDGENARDDNEEVVEDLFASRNLLAEKLQVKSQGQAGMMSGMRVERHCKTGPNTYMTQIVKQRALPINAIMLSNAGKRMEMTRNDSTTKTRMATLRAPRK